MQITQTAIDGYKAGNWFEIDNDVLDYLIQEEYNKTLQLFNCTAFQAINKNGYTIIYHTCTKSTGYQISYYDSNMKAISDIFATTKEELTQKAIDTYNIIQNYTIQEVI